MKNKHIFTLILLFVLLFYNNCKKEVIKTVPTSKSLLLSGFSSVEQPNSKYKITFRWSDLDSATNTAYHLKLYDLNNQQVFNDSMVTAKTITLNNVDENHPYAIRIISDPKLDSTKLKFKVTMGNVDITVFDRW